MPQPKIPSTKKRRAAVNTQIDTAEVDPKELAKLEKSINSRDQAPTVAAMTPTAEDWKRFSTTLASPFDKDRAPTLAQLRQIRKDPMIAFGLHYIKVPIARMNWMIDARDKNGPNAQVAAFIDAALRKIYARYVFQRTQALDFGFKAQVKRFILENPGGVYRESSEKESDPVKRIKPVWDEGNILPYIWKNPVGLRPELVTPRFVETGPREGEFDGVLYEVPANQRTKAQGFASSKNKNDAAGKVIDVYHALWGTNMKDEEDGSLYGFPRVAYAKDYWWDYNMIRGFGNRAFERLAIPPIIARYPLGSTDLGDGQLIPNWQIALEAAERLRSNSVAAVPSTMQEAGLDSVSNHPAWDFKFLETPTESLSQFDAKFNYLNVMKLRCVTADTPVDCPRDHAKYPDGIPISELVEGQLIWCFNENLEEFQLRPIKRVEPTRPNAKLLKLTLDTGKTIRATPDHKFLKRDGTWCELQNLQAGDSLMPLDRDFEPFVRVKPNVGWTRKPREGREMDIVAQASYGEKGHGIAIHHMDDRHINTSPENLKYLTNGEHSTLTHKGKKRSPKWRENIVSGYSARICLDCSEKFKPRGSNSKRCGVCQSIYRFETIREKANLSLNKISHRELKICKSCSNEYMPSGNAQKWCEECRVENWVEKSKAKRGLAALFAEKQWASQLSNHKVLSIEECDNEDTWDLSVDGPPECHSFVSQGIVLHNSIWVPEQAFIEGAGGQSSRNVASQMAQIFEASQQLLMEEIASEINQYMIPQLLFLNFPEFLNNGGSAKMISHGFRAEDLDFYKQIIQLLGQADPALMGRIDTDEMFERINVPLKDARDYEIEQRELATDLANQAPPLVEPTATTVGTVANPTAAAGGTNGGSVPEPNPVGTVVAGFSDNNAGTWSNSIIYQQPQATYSPAMMFADSETDDFLASLPKTKHYSDKTIRSLTLQLRRLWRNHFNSVYPELAGHVSKINSFVNLADEAGERIFFADDDGAIKRVTKAQAEKAAKAILKSFSVSTKVIDSLRATSAEILRKISSRSAKLDLRKTKRTDTEITKDAWDNWLENQTGRLIKFTDNTLRNEVQQFLINNIREGKAPDEIASELSDHYKEFPDSKANVIARSETRDAVNAGTLISAEASGINYLKASDGTEFDEKCKERDGTIYTLKEAWKEMRDVHPNDTLSFDPVPRAEFSVQPVSRMPEGTPENAGVYYDDESSTAYVLADVPNEDCKQFLAQLSDWLIEQESEFV